MDLRQLEVFCAVCEERSFSRAAARLDLAQPTVSGHVKALETFFGVALLDRLGRETVPTRAGDLLYQRALEMLETKRLTLEGMSRLAGGLEGELRIVASSIPGEFLLPALIVRFNRRHPGIRVHGDVGDSRQVIQAVEEGKADLGLAGARLPGPSLEYTRFASDHLVLAVPPSDRWRSTASVSFDELRSEPLVMRERGSGTRAAVERHLAERGYGLDDFDLVAELGSTAAVKEAVRLGVGWSIVSDLAVRTEVAAKLVRTLPIAGVDPWPRDFFVVRDPRRSVAPTVEVFLELLECEEGGGEGAALPAREA